MDRFRSKFDSPPRGIEMHGGTSSAILTHRFVAESLRREERQEEDLAAVRGIVKGLLLGVLGWIFLGMLLFIFV